MNFDSFPSFLFFVLVPCLSEVDMLSLHTYAVDSISPDTITPTFEPENKCTMVLQDFSKYLPADTAPHLKKLEYLEHRCENIKC